MTQTSNPDRKVQTRRLSLDESFQDVPRHFAADDDLIGDCLGIDPAAVATLIAIGRQKLAAEKRANPRPAVSDSDRDLSMPADDLG